MSILLTVAITAFITWIFVYEKFYSPKALIKRLWDANFTLARKIAEQERQFPDTGNPLVEIYQGHIRRNERLINAFLDYYFDPEEDEVYLGENRPR